MNGPKSRWMRSGKLAKELGVSQKAVLENDVPGFIIHKERWWYDGAENRKWWKYQARRKAQVAITVIDELGEFTPEMARHLLSLPSKPSAIETPRRESGSLYEILTDDS